MHDYDEFEQKFLEEWDISYDNKFLLNQIHEAKN